MTSNSLIFGMVIVLIDFVTGCPNLSEDQQTLSTVRVFYNLDHAIAWTYRDFWHMTYIYNIVYLEISPNRPKKDHLRIRVIPQVHRTRSFMYQSSAHVVEEKKGSSFGVGRTGMTHFSCHIDTESHIQCSVKGLYKLMWPSKYCTAGLDVYNNQQSRYHQGNAKKGLQVTLINNLGLISCIFIFRIRDICMSNCIYTM